MDAKIYNPEDTICAISTPAGVGGIAVIRLSGSDALRIASHLWKGKKLTEAASHTAHLGEIVNQSGEVIDQAVATVFRGPKSFTGQDTVEFSVHGSRWIQREVLKALISAGARLAERGEFTQRAMLSGRMDLAQAEAVADIIASESKAAHRIAVSQASGEYSRHLSLLRSKLVDLASLLELELDFSEEDVEFASRENLKQLTIEIRNEISRLLNSFKKGTAIKNGIPVAIVGATNAGKSSLLNAILGTDRAIVSQIHGTTRDTIEETIELGDFTFRFIDTAGIRRTDDEVEQIGIERSLQALNKAQIIIAVIDCTAPAPTEILDQIRQTEHNPEIILALNKTDLPHTEQTRMEIEETVKDSSAQILPISAKNQTGIDTLTEKLIQYARRELDTSESLLVTNQRHATALEQALLSADAVLTALDTNLPGDLIAQDVRQTLHHLSTITGQIPTTEILTTIFSRFCIGK